MSNTKIQRPQIHGGPLVLEAHGREVPAVEVCPGVFVLPDGSARGPGLEQALALAADVLTLNAWARLQSGREWAPLSWDGPHATCCLSERFTVRIQAFEAETLSEAIRAAADAIRNGRV